MASFTTMRNALTLSTTAQFSQIAFDGSLEDRTLPAILNLEACEHKDDERKVIDVVIVLDKSGSMSGNKKLGLCLKTAEFLTKQLTKRDRLGIISYDTHVSEDLPLTYMDAKGRATALDSIKRIRAGSMTNLSGGALKGIETIQRGMKNSEADVKSVLLLTDGLANQGITGSQSIVAAVKGALEMTKGVKFYTFGFGSDHDEKLLKDLSEITQSSYYFIESSEGIPSAFGDCLGGLLTLIAQNVSVVIKPAGCQNSRQPNLWKLSGQRDWCRHAV